MSQLITDPEEIRELYEFIKQKPLSYPDYSLWAEKCHRELQMGYKKGLVYRIDEKIIANMIFQPHKEDALCLEIKNGRVEYGFEGRGIFTELYHAVEKYAKEKGFKRIICDAHAESEQVVNRFLKWGFKIESRENLYKGGLELILVKDID